MDKNENIIALLVDADHNCVEHMKEVLNTLSAQGRVAYRRVYGKSTKGKDFWVQSEEIGFKAVTHACDKQNATDIRLCMDAVKILYTKRPNTVCIMASDGDYVALVNELREEGARVLCAVKCSSVPQGLVSVCEDVIYIDDLSRLEVKSEDLEKLLQHETEEPTVGRPSDELLREIIFGILEKEEDKVVCLQALCNGVYGDERIKKSFPKFRFGQGGAKKFFEERCEGRLVIETSNNVMYIRLK